MKFRVIDRAKCARAGVGRSGNPSLFGREFECHHVDRDKEVIFDDFQRRFAPRQLEPIDDDARALLAELALSRRDAGDHPWENEPNDATWMRGEFRCSIQRNPVTLTLCGYVDLPEGHPWGGLSDDGLNAHQDTPTVHGGFTYAGRALRVRRVRWRIGFDCAHGGDLIPAQAQFMARVAAKVGTYRTFSWVKTEVEMLADAAKRAWDIALGTGR